MSETPNEEDRAAAPNGQFMKYAMIACCAVMLLPVATFFLAGGAISGLWENAGVFAPLALCVGMHFVLHRVMGKSCHGEASEKQADISVEANATVTEMPSRIPVVARAGRG